MTWNERFIQNTGYWGKFERLQFLHDEIIIDAATYAAMVNPVFALSFGRWKVPPGKMLWVRSITVRSPWHSLSTAAMSCVLTAQSVPPSWANGWVDPIGTVMPSIGSALSYLEAPATNSSCDAIIEGGLIPVVYCAGVPFPELSGTGGGVSVDIQGEIVMDMGV